ncbi:MAG TPA: transglutaminase domain-containing protein [Chitinophagaceae bacterium]
MIPPFRILILFALTLVQNYLSAQEKFDIKFGKVSPADFDLSAYKFDTSAGAVYVCDKGVTEFEGDRGNLKLNFRRQLRIKVLNKNGFDAAEFSIPFYKSGSGEYILRKIEATTYNLENGKVKKVEMENKSIFVEKISKYWSLKKFTLPAVQEGSIIEVSYTIETVYKNHLFPWDFQGRFPRIWSEYQATVPGFLDYIFLKRGFHPYHITTQTPATKTYSITEDGEGMLPDRSFTITSPVIIARWVMKDVPGVAEQPYITSMNNYTSSLSFQLTELKEPYTPKKIMTNWNEFSDLLLKDSDFGVPFLSFNDWLNQDINTITAGADNPLQKSKKIYEYVRDNFVCSRNALYASNPLADVYKTKNGNVADINLLLIAMLRHQGLAAEPVILSTREHGITNVDHPLVESYDYVIASVDIGGKRIYLDATVPSLAFGKLPLSCYNGHARLVNVKSPEALYFKADTLRETKVTSVILHVDDKGRIAGTFGSKLGYYESLNLRRRFGKEGLNNEQLLQSIKKKYPVGIELNNLILDSLKNVDQPIQLKYNLDGEIFKEDLVYFNPMLAEGYTDNLFKAAQRIYPVEMPCTTDETYVFSMDIPAGYTVDEVPSSVRIDLGDDGGFFEYKMTKSLATVNLRMRINVSRARFETGEYQRLRDFFAQIIKKQSEQIVFKKKK